MDFNESVKNFLEAVVAELGVEDATVMFAFLGTAVKGSPGKLRGMAKVFRDPATLKEIQGLSSAKSKIALVGKITKLYKKFS